MKRINEKEYYNLKELLSVTELKYRQLLNRVKEVYEKHGSNKELIYRKSNIWFIHHTLVSEFKRKRKLILYKFWLVISPSPDNNYNMPAWYNTAKRLHNKFKAQYPSAVTRYTIEQRQDFVNHLNFLTTLTNINKIRSIVRHDIVTNDSENKMNLHVKPIYNIESQQTIIKYIEKDMRSVILR